MVTGNYMRTESTRQDYDLHSAITELDVGMRSQRQSDRFEAVGKIPAQIQKTPFPVFVNAALLRLAEAFKDGNNLLRKCCVDTVRKISHLLAGQVTSVDELTKRVLTVAHSNDMEARGLTLNMLAAMSPVLSEQKEIHHLILNSMDSHDEVEVRAAIAATNAYAQYSAVFSRGIFDKLSQLLTAGETSLDTRMELVKVFRHMHSDGGTTTQVFALCRSELLESPDERFLIVLVRSLTALAVNSVIAMDEHLDLMLSMLAARQRLGVAVVVLNSLTLVAAKAPHLWTAKHLNKLVDFQPLTNKHCCCAFWTVFEHLSATFTVPFFEFLTSSNDSFRERLLTACRSDDDKTVVAAVSFALNAANMAETAEFPDLNKFFHNLFVETVSCQLFLLKFSEVTTCAKFLRLITGESLKHTKDDMVNVILQAVNQRLLSNDLFGYLFVESVCSLTDRRPALSKSVALWAVGLLQQCSTLTPLLLSNLIYLSIPIGERLPKEDSEFLKTLLTTRCDNNYWNSYRTARTCMRKGAHQLALHFLEAVTPMCVGLVNRKWLSALQLLAKAEVALDAESTIDDALLYYGHALMTLKSLTAFNTVGSQFEFASRFCAVRRQFLTAARDLLTIWNESLITPPPLASANSDDGEKKCAVVRSKMSKCVDSINACAEQYQQVRLESLDADRHTLASLELLEAFCSLLARALSVLVIKSNTANGSVVANQLTTDNDDTGTNGENITWRNAHRLWKEDLEKKCQQNVENPTAGLEFVINLLRETLRLPFFFPRFFFQRLQKTNVQLQLCLGSDKRPNKSEIKVPLGLQLSFKVEGVVARDGKRRAVRSFDEAIVTTRSELTTQSGHNLKLKTLQRRIAIFKGYFEGEFLMDFPSSGVLNVDVKLVDVEARTVCNCHTSLQLKIVVV